MMNDPIHFGVMIVIGMLLGAIFFGGLWITVQHMHKSKRPGILLLASVIPRTAIVLAGIWYFADGSAMSIAACLAGFIGIRLLATHGATVFGKASDR